MSSFRSRNGGIPIDAENVESLVLVTEPGDPLVAAASHQIDACTAIKGVCTALGVQDIIASITNQGVVSG